MCADRKAVVLLDDEKSYLEVLGPLLESGLECPVHAFARPKEALAAFDHLSVGVVVTDFHMPDMNGLQLVALAQETHPNLRFIMITGHGLVLNEEEAATYHALKAVLHKPFGWRTLAEAIRHHWPDEAVPSIKR